MPCSAAVVHNPLEFHEKSIPTSLWLFFWAWRLIGLLRCHRSLAYFSFPIPQGSIHGSGVFGEQLTLVCKIIPPRGVPPFRSGMWISKFCSIYRWPHISWLFFHKLLLAVCLSQLHVVVYSTWRKDGHVIFISICVYVSFAAIGPTSNLYQFHSFTWWIFRRRPSSEGTGIRAGK